MDLFLCLKLRMCLYLAEVQYRCRVQDLINVWPVFLALQV